MKIIEKPVDNSKLLKEIAGSRLQVINKLLNNKTKNIKELEELRNLLIKLNDIQKEYNNTNNINTSLLNEVQYSINKKN